MLSMPETKTAHVAIYDTFADWEVGHLLAELRSGRFTSEPFAVVSVAETPEPVTTTGGVRMLPDALVADLDPADSDLLILPGADLWDTAAAPRSRPPPARFLDAGVPVAAICGATVGLAAAGLLDDAPAHERRPEYLAAIGLRRRRALRRRPRGHRRRPHHRGPAVARPVRARDARSGSG